MGFEHKTYETWRTTQLMYRLKNVYISNETAENVNFHFSQYKSMETISYHSNQSSYPTGMKNVIYVEANVLGMYFKFQLHTLNGF